MICYDFLPKQRCVDQTSFTLVKKYRTKQHFTSGAKFSSLSQKLLFVNFHVGVLNTVHSFLSLRNTIKFQITFRVFCYTDLHFKTVYEFGWLTLEKKIGASLIYFSMWNRWGMESVLLKISVRPSTVIVTDHRTSNRYGVEIRTHYGVWGVIVIYGVTLHTIGTYFYCVC